MARLPTPGQDDGTWGDILNAFLAVSHARDGTLNSSVVGTNQLQSGSVTNAQLDSPTQTSLTKANSAVQSVNGKTGTSITLAAGDVSAVASSQVGANSGVAQLDSGGKLLVAQVPSSVALTSSAGGTVTLDQLPVPANILKIPAGSNIGNGSSSDFTGLSNVRNVEIDYIQPISPATSIPGLIVQGHALYVKYFGPTTQDSQQADSSGVFLVDIGSPFSTTKPTVGNESDAVNQGNSARAYGGRVIGHIASVQAQTGGTSNAGGIIDYAYAYSAKNSAARDSATLIRQHAQYQAEDQTSSSSGTIGAAWSVFVPKSIHTQDSVTIAGYTGVEGDLSTSYIAGVSTIVLETGQGTTGLKGGSFPGSGTVQIDVGVLAEAVTYTISGDTLTLGSATKFAHSQYARVAVLDSNGLGSWRMVSNQLTSAAVINVQATQAGQFVLNFTNGQGYFSYIKQTSTPSTPSSTRVLSYVNNSGQPSWMGSDGFEHHVSSTPLEEILLTGLGYQSWAFDPGLTSGSTAPTAGTTYVRALPLRAGQQISFLDFLIGQQGVGTAPTHIYVGLCNSAGQMLTQSSDLASSSIWTAGALIEKAPLSSTYTVPADGLYYVVFLQVGSWGTTQLTLTKGVSNAAPGGIGTNMFGTAGTSQTALPANGSSLTIVTTNAVNYWVAAS